jgi:hypothetical protein
MNILISNYITSDTEVRKAEEKRKEAREILLKKFSNIMTLYYVHRKKTQNYEFWAKYIIDFNEDSDFLDIDEKYGMVEYEHICKTDWRGDPSDKRIRIPIKLFDMSDTKLKEKTEFRQQERERLYKRHTALEEKRKQKEKEEKELEIYQKLKEKYGTDYELT